MRAEEDDAMRTTNALSRQQVGATRRTGSFLAVPRAFLSSGVPERTPEDRGWPGFAGWMKVQIRAKRRNRGTTGQKRGNEESWLEMLLQPLGPYPCLYLGIISGRAGSGQAERKPDYIFCWPGPAVGPHLPTQARTVGLRLHRVVAPGLH
jgi:hypothetical protein